MLAPVALALRPWSGFPLRRVEAPFSIKGAPPPSRLIHVHISSIGKGIDELRKVCSKSYSFRIRAVAVDSSHLGSSQTTDEESPKRYHFLVANAKFMLDEEEHFKELLFEKLRNYGERNKEQDFWLLIEPKFLDQFPDITKRLRRPAVALVSTDDRWITFMKLRLDRVLAGNYEADTLGEALASNNAELRFKKPDKWVAPYPKYEFGWWEPFLPQLSTQSQT